MHTEHVSYDLPEYLSNTLDETLRPWVERHLETCGECRAELETLRAAFERLEGHEVSQPGPAYFTSVLPRVRQKLEGKKPGLNFANPLITRFALPLAVGALCLLVVLRLPVNLHESEAEHNPLQPVVRGLETEELVDVILDQLHRQTLGVQGESESSAMLAAPFLHGENLLAGTDKSVLAEEPLFDVGTHERLDRMSASDVDALVARLGERTVL